MENILFLKDKAKKFFKVGIKLFQEKIFDLAAFSLEQSCQLFVKYLIAKKVGEWPKTHFLSVLIKELAKIYNEDKILEFFNEKELFFDDLEDAYFTS
ncbi:MAG: HEPN domain-containing protein [Elusimicrobiota bacterium]|nr:HEPN domain-containing protein [Endomicrobiia bacterium]MDW8166480.1 HEPN domain-containing protein [Elusimicrobiota bacterium]